MKRSPRKFVIVEGGLLHPDSPDDGMIDVGTIVYQCAEPDYGTALEDTLWTNRLHVSVTLDPSGGYPFFTIEKARLQELRMAANQ